MYVHVHIHIPPQRIRSRVTKQWFFRIPWMYKQTAEGARPPAVCTNQGIRKNALFRVIKQKLLETSTSYTFSEASRPLYPLPYTYIYLHDYEYVYEFVSHTHRYGTPT